MEKHATQEIILANVKLFAVTGGDGDKMICLDVEKKVRSSIAGGWTLLKESCQLNLNKER